MNRQSSKIRWMAAAAGIVLGLMTRSGALAAPEDPRCTCWYDGYEDGTEFPSTQIREAEHYAACQKKGNQSSYEDGFTASQGHKKRKCPL